MTNFVIRLDWRCDVQYRKIEAKDFIEVINKLEKRYKLTNVNAKTSACSPPCSIHEYCAMTENSGWVNIEIVEIRKDITMNKV